MTTRTTIFAAGCAALCVAACSYEHTEETTERVDCARVCTGESAATDCPAGCAFGLDQQEPPPQPEQPAQPEQPDPPPRGRATLLGPIFVELACEDPAEDAALYVGLSDSCGDWSQVDQLQVWPLSDVDTAIYWFDVPDLDDYALQAFIDCDGDAAASNTPSPSPADRHFELTAEDGSPQLCRWYRLGRGNYYLELPIAINAACAP